MMHNLPDGPAFGPIRCLELFFRKTPNGFPKPHWGISDLLDERAPLGIGYLSGGLEIANGIT